MEVMIDIETLDTKTSAVVFEVAAIFFEGTERFEYRWALNTTYQLNNGRTLSKDTVEFHLKNVSTAEYLGFALADETALSVPELEVYLAEAFNQHEPTACWAKGNFDYPILEDMLDAVPWRFYQLRELRTLMKECGVPKGKVAHSALDDCTKQIANLKKCRVIIKKGSK